MIDNYQKLDENKAPDRDQRLTEEELRAVMDRMKVPWTRWAWLSFFTGTLCAIAAAWIGTYWQVLGATCLGLVLACIALVLGRFDVIGKIFMLLGAALLGMIISTVPTMDGLLNTLVAILGVIAAPIPGCCAVIVVTDLVQDRRRQKQLSRQR